MVFDIPGQAVIDVKDAPWKLEMTGKLDTRYLKLSVPSMIMDMVVCRGTPAFLTKVMCALAQYANASQSFRFLTEEQMSPEKLEQLDEIYNDSLRVR